MRSKTRWVYAVIKCDCIKSSVHDMYIHSNNNKILIKHGCMHLMRRGLGGAAPAAAGFLHLRP